MARGIPISVTDGTEDSAMRFYLHHPILPMPSCANPQRLAGLAFGILIPLLGRGACPCPAHWRVVGQSSVQHSASLHHPCRLRRAGPRAP